MTDWYRRHTWTKTDEEEFFVKLGRARKGSREQYLKIQAIELVSTNDDKLLEVAESLLLKFLVDYPDDKFNRNSVLETLGDIYQRRQKPERALDYYKQAIDFEATYPNVKTNAYLSFSELVIKLKQIGKYDFVESIINDRVKHLSFPLEKYKAYSILSIINAYNNRTDIASNYSQLAEQNSTAETSDFRYHKYLGLVKESDRWLDKLIKRK